MNGTYPNERTKVVFDSGILAKSKLSRHPPRRFRPQELKSKTKDLITAESKAAEIAEVNLLILAFGHGDKETHGIVLGKGATIKIGELERATKVYKVGITMMTKFCYLGGWTCHPQLNLSDCG